MLPHRLYKYLPDQYVDTVVKQGKLLFRTLSYFQRVEDPERGDRLESMHIDRPGTGVTLTVSRTGQSFTGDFAFINRVQADRIYCFCFSRRKDADLFRQFGSNTCVEILDIRELLRRWHRAVKKLKSSSEWELIHRDVEYFHVARAALADIKNPRNLPFFKLETYAHQDEYRLVAARTRYLKLIQEIVDARRYDFGAEAKAFQVRQIPFKLGCLEDITRTHRL
jgi:hypothetical protein